MNNEIYIIDVDNQILGNEIQRLCVMADIQPPELPRQTMEFLKEHFGSLPFMVFKRAIDYWLSGKMSTLRKPAKINAHFLSLMMRDYIEVFRHNIKMKPRPMLEAPKIEYTDEQRHEQNKKSYDLTFIDFKNSLNGDTRLIPHIMHLIGERKLNEGKYPITEKELTEAMGWLENYEARRDKAIESSGKRGFEIIKKIQATYRYPPSISKIDTIAIVYIHFKRRLSGQEKEWY
jgi:hypothetical protein